jgi:vacuolar-type H+-ATPase subunit F/Vma7
MGEVVAIGAEPLIRGYALAGVRLVPADTEDEVRAAFTRLDDGVDLVILTAAAECALGEAAIHGRSASSRAEDHPLVAVLP